MTTKPLKYQRQAVRMMDYFGGRALLADDMGLGKSFESLLWAYENETYPVVVVTRAGLKYNWEREAKIHLGLRAEVLEGMKPRPLNPKTKIFIINYDILGPWLKALRKIRPRLIIVDECQDIKNRKAKRTKNVRKLCSRRKHVMMLSGTPLTNRPAELFPALNILRPDVFNSFFSYAMRYCDPQRRPWGWEYKGAAHLDELHELLSETCMIRRTKEQVLKYLPRQARFVVPLEIQDRREYNLALKDFIGWLAKQKSKGKLERAKKAERLVKTGYLKRLVAELKLQSVMDWIDTYLEESDEKLIVFGIHKKRFLYHLRERYKKTCVYIDGSVTGRKRHEAVVKFNRSKRRRLMIAQQHAGGVGWSATDCAVVAHGELSYVPADHTQCEDRVRGLGRGKKGRRSQAYYLVARDTVEEPLCKLLQKKQRDLEATLDGVGKGLDLDVFDQLMEELRKGYRKAG